MKGVIWVNPFRCCLWEDHARLEEYISEESCRSEIESVKRNGQLIPAIVRPKRGNGEFEWEVICGARRLFVARHLNVQLYVDVREVSDKEAIVLLDMENRQRKDLSPYERGRALAHWLKQRHFSSQEDLAKALEISPAQVSRLLKMNRLPSVVLAAFSSPLDIRENWAGSLLAAWEDEEGRRRLIANARRLSESNYSRSADEIYELLLSDSWNRRFAGDKSTRDEIVMDRAGKAAFRIRHQRQAVAVVIKRGKLTTGQLVLLKQMILGMLSESEGKGLMSPVATSVVKQNGEKAWT